MTGDHPNTFRIASVSSVILTLSDGLLRGPSTKRAKRTNRLADKLRGRGAAPDPTAWFAERTTLGLGSYCLTTCTYPDDSEFVPGKTGDYPITFRLASLSSLILALSDGLLRGPCYSSLIHPLLGTPF